MNATVTKLRCEHLPHPLGGGTPTPRLSWEIESDGENLIQAAYRVQVWETKDVLLWDSGRVESPRQHEILYAGAPLQPRGSYAWRVQVWLDDGSGSGWSEPAAFETGFFSVKDWKAGWAAYRWCHVAPEQQSVCFLRHEFNVENIKTLRRARAFVAATAGAHGNDTLRMNLYQLRLNGRKVGNDLYNPGQLSEVKGRALYRAFDLSGSLNEGANAVGLIFAAAKVSVELLLERLDGSVELVRSWTDWKMRLRGPFVRLWRHDVYEYGGKGEHYDAREEFTGWDSPGFDEAGWGTVNNHTAPPGILAPQAQSVEVYETLKPEKLVASPGGRLVADFGRCLNGHVALKAEGPRGTRIALRFAETLHPDGSIDPSSTLSAQRELSVHEDVYIKKSDAPEDYAPTFANHGFRYVELDGWRGGELQANAVCSAVGRDAFFSCSDPRTMQLHQLCERTFLSNLMSVCTDCPSRERQGWPGDAQAIATAQCAMFDMRLFYEKWFDDMADEQDPDGCLPYLTPFPKVRIGTELAWGGGFLSMAWDAFMAYGDRVFLARHYDAFQRWGDFLLSIQESDGLSRGHCNYCDHLAQDYPSREFFENAHAYRSFRFLEKIATALGLEAGAHRHHAEQLRSALNSKFLHDGVYGLGTQSEAVHALAFGLVPEELRAGMLEKLCAQLEEELHFRTGIIGTNLLMRLLADEGKNDLAWKLAMSDKLRSWRHWIVKHGATTALEAWDGAETKHGTWNHPAFLGGIAAWLYRELGGIKPLSPGYERISIRPFVPAGVESAAARVMSPFGLVESSWTFKPGVFELTLELPVGTTAELWLPGAAESRQVGSGRCRIAGF